MLSTAVPSRRRERKPSHHDSPLNKLIYSSFSVPAPQITHGMVIICLTLGLSEVLGKRDQSNSFKSSLLDCSYTGKFWRKSPVHLAGKNTYKPSNVSAVFLGILLVVPCPQFWLTIINDQNGVVTLYRCNTGVGRVGECSDNLRQLDREPPHSDNFMWVYNSLSVVFSNQVSSAGGYMFEVSGYNPRLVTQRWSLSYCPSRISV